VSIITLRGVVYRADLGFGPKPWLVVSNNARNTRLGDSIAVRIVTAQRDLPAWVRLSAGDPLPGSVNCDDLTLIHHYEIDSAIGELSAETMMQVGRALKHALAL
jgi:mRNA interferase MazF